MRQSKHLVSQSKRLGLIKALILTRQQDFKFEVKLKGRAYIIYCRYIALGIAVLKKNGISAKFSVSSNVSNVSHIHVIQQQSIRHSKACVLRILVIYNTLTFGIKKALFLCMDKCGGERIEVPYFLIILLKTSILMTNR